MNRRFRMLLLLLVAALSLSLAAPAGAATQLRLALSGDEGSLNPYTYVTGSPGFNLVQLVYDPLYRLDLDNVARPLLVKDAQVTEGGKVWTLKLHENVKWHDGKPLTSADVAFTYDFVRTKEGTHSRYTSPSKVIQKIETPDATTVIFTLSKALPSFAIRPLADTPILPKHIWEGQKEPKKFKDVVGSGPFKVAEYKPDQFYRLEANQDYFQGKPNIDGVVLPIIKDTTAMFTALKAGEVDAAARSLTPELIQQFKGQAGIKVVQGPGYGATLLQLNTERPPMDKKEFRQALDLAVDKKALVETVLLGLGVAASPGFVHPSSVWANTRLQPRFDAAKAKQLLDGLGMKDADNDGFREKADGSKLDLALLVYANNPLRVRAAEMISANLKAVGIKGTVKAMDPTTVDSLVWPEFDVSKGRNFDMALWGWSAPIQIDPARLRDLVHSDVAKGNINIGAFKNADADKLSDDLAAAVDEKTQKEVAGKLQELIAEQVPFITLWFPEEAFAYNPKVHDGWAYAKGQGIVNVLSFFPVKKEAVAAAAAPAATQAAPAQKEPEKAPARSGNLWWFLIGAAALAGVFLVVRRRAAG